VSRIRIVQWGLGAMGSRMASLVVQKPGLELAGVIDNAPHRVGRSVGQLLGIDSLSDLTVTDNPESALRDRAVDVVLHATTSFALTAWPQIRYALEQHCNVITIAEEMSFVSAQNKALAEQVDRLASQTGVTILGTGVNPGFILDTLVISLTAVCSHIKRITATRINDLSPFGPTVLKSQGVGCTPIEFEEGVRAGRIVGHVGFPESLSMIGNRLGWTFDEIRQSRKPILSTTRRETDHVVVEPGQVAGCKHVAQGLINGQVVVELVHPQQVRPDLEDIETGDFIAIDGEPGIHLAIRPEIPGGIATAALVVNMIPAVLKAPPGLATMIEMPVPSMLPQDFLGHQR
jgi:hypothetical protein